MVASVLNHVIAARAGPLVSSVQACSRTRQRSVLDGDQKWTPWRALEDL
jgi:hypothetical protein